jgi:hypothetical protein
MTIEEVQDRFNECFPSLTIEFYSVPHKRFQPSDSQYRYGNKVQIGTIRTNHRKGAMEIKSWYSVAQVEKELQQEYGLNAQIFRTSVSGQPIQTSSSDHLTLQEQKDLVMEQYREHHSV